MIRALLLSTLTWLLPLWGQTVPATQAAADANPTGIDRVLEDGIPVKLQLSKALSSADAKVGQEIEFEVVDEIDIDGIPVLRSGAVAIGIVTEAAPKKRLGRAGKLSFKIESVPLADHEKAPLRALNNSKGDSHTEGMIDLMLNMPMASAPFFLLIKGTDTSFPKGTEITAFIDGDVHVDLSKFVTSASGAEMPGSLVIGSTPSGADIEVNRAVAGVTPATLHLAPGDYQIVLKKKGFEDWIRTVTVATVTLRLDAVLVEAR